MDVQFAFVCESAEQKDGSLSATGIGRNYLDFDTSSLILCGQIGFSLLDVGSHVVDIELEDPDGRVLWSESLAVDFFPPDDPDVAYGVAPFLFRLLDLSFDAPGPHLIRIATLSRELFSIPLHLARES